MRTATVVLAFAVAVLLTGTAPGLHAQGGAWTPLFNGKNLDNWDRTGNANWRVVNGVLEADMPRGFLLTRESYDDFELRAEIWTTPESNGGVLFRITNPKDPGIENGYELNINDKRADQRGRTGAIVNVASGAGLVGFPGLPAYVASKHGVVGLTKAAALEYAAAGVRVNAVCPGSTRSAMLEGYMAQDPRVERMMVAGVPLGRLGLPDEIAAAILWLCSDAASFVVGHALAVDGGSVVQ